MYIPWNDTWVFLPPLPVLEDGSEVVQPAAISLPEMILVKFGLALIGGRKVKDEQWSISTTVFGLDLGGGGWSTREGTISKYSGCY